MNRRTFSTVLAAAPLLGQSGRRVRAAFLGASHSHAAAKVKLVMASPKYELAGIWEPDAKVREGYAKLGSVTLVEKKQILDDKSIEVIFVESGVKDHAQLALEAVSTGKHVHIEKPPARTMDEFNRIVQIAREKKLHLQTGYMWRFNPATLRVIEAVRQGWLGDVYMIHARMNTLVDAASRAEWSLFSGGQMFEMGSHLIDFIVRLLGKPSKVTSFLRHDGAFDDTLKDNTAAVLEYKRAMAVITSSTLQPRAFPLRTIEVFGSRGNAVIRPIEPPSLEVDLAEDAGPYIKGAQKVVLPRYERYVGDIEEMAVAILEAKPLGVSLDEELTIQETVLVASGMA